jgi:hypothetical protein
MPTVEVLEDIFSIFAYFSNEIIHLQPFLRKKKLQIVSELYFYRGNPLKSKEHQLSGLLQNKQIDP